MAKTIQTKAKLTIVEFKAVCKTKSLNIVASKRTDKLYAKSDDDKIVATVSKDIKLDQPIEVLHMIDSDSSEEWYFMANITEYAPIGVL